MTSLTADTSVLVVGASAAGTAVALNLREEGFAGPITLVGDESRLPYDRPPLSKAVLLGQREIDSIGLTDFEELERQRITLQLGTRAASVDLAAHQVQMSSGGTLDFDLLVIATGASCRSISFGGAYRNVHTLRTFEDAVSLRASLGPSRRLGIVGGGLIGLEVAATARSLGTDVFVVEPQTTPLADRLTPLVAEWLLREHESRGVALHLGATVDRVVADGDDVTHLVLGDGQELPVDAVLVAVGATPNVSWLEDCPGIVLGNGVVCDEFHRAGTDVYALGDVANIFNPVLGRHMRFEHRSNASEAAAHLARNLMHDETPYLPVPFFWTDQYELKIQIFGIVDGLAEPEFVHGSLAEDRWILALRTNERLTAVVARDFGPRLNHWRKTLQETQLSTT